LLSFIQITIQSIINHDLKELDEWSKRWLMTFNPDKTELMLFTNLEHPEINFTFEDNIIKTGRPVTILAASSCSLSNLLAFTDPQLSQTSEAYSNIGLL
jgi:hypothetical protein